MKLSELIEKLTNQRLIGMNDDPTYDPVITTIIYDDCDDCDETICTISDIEPDGDSLNLELTAIYECDTCNVMNYICEGTSEHKIKELEKINKNLFQANQEVQKREKILRDQLYKMNAKFTGSDGKNYDFSESRPTVSG